MSISVLEKFLPDHSLPFLKKWFGEYNIHIKITRERQSKLGDYQRLPDKSHKISINYSLPPQLFFFVLTHELAHLIAFEVNKPKRIAPHGTEWKQTFRDMLLESLAIYEENLQPVIFKFSKYPKANFMASPDLVQYFKFQTIEEGTIAIHEIKSGDFFNYRNQKYRLEGKIKKNYLCTQLATGRKYSFKPLARVKIIS